MTSGATVTDGWMKDQLWESTGTNSESGKDPWGSTQDKLASETENSLRRPAAGEADPWSSFPWQQTSQCVCDLRFCLTWDQELTQTQTSHCADMNKTTSTDCSILVTAGRNLQSELCVQFICIFECSVKSMGYRQNVAVPSGSNGGGRVRGKFKNIKGSTFLSKQNKWASTQNNWPVASVAVETATFTPVFQLAPYFRRCLELWWRLFVCLPSVVTFHWLKTENRSELK